MEREKRHRTKTWRTNSTWTTLRKTMFRLTCRLSVGQITLGRATKDKQIDVDLSLEGPAWKISRKQGDPSQWQGLVYSRKYPPRSASCHFITFYWVFLCIFYSFSHKYSLFSCTVFLDLPYAIWFVLNFIRLFLLHHYDPSFIWPVFYPPSTLLCVLYKVDFLIHLDSLESLLCSCMESPS